MSSPPQDAAAQMDLGEEILQALTKLEGGRFPEGEVYLKTGRSRRQEIGLVGQVSVSSQERGWAVRASDDRASLFAAGTGAPDPAGPWPDADGRPFHLPEPAGQPEDSSDGTAWHEPAEFDAPLTGEREGLALLAAIAEALAEEAPKARLSRAALEDGASEAHVLSSRGVRGSHRSRLAALHLEAHLGGSGGSQGSPSSVSLYLAERDLRHFQPKVLARRLADRLLVRAHGKTPRLDRGEFLLAPSVAVALLHGLLPLLVGPGAIPRAQALQDRRGRIGGEPLTILDNGRLPGGALEAPVDGEGVATREILLMDRGTFRQPLLAWHQASREASDPHHRQSGCSRRASYKDLPTPGPTHLWLRPDAEVPVSQLLAAITRGYYLIEPAGVARFDFDGDRFTLPVSGFEIRAGQAQSPIAGTRLCGPISALLRGLQATARDLTFFPLDGMLGSPTLLTTGLELRGG